MSDHFETGVKQAKEEMVSSTIDHYRMRAEAIRQAAGAGDEEWEVRSQTAQIAIPGSGVALIYQVNYAASKVRSLDVAFWSETSGGCIGNVGLEATGEVVGSVTDDSDSPEYVGSASLLDPDFMLLFGEYKRLVDGLLGLGEQATGIMPFADAESISLASEFLSDLAQGASDTTPVLENA